MSFEYDIHLSSIPGSNSRTVICFHEYGGNVLLIEKLKQFHPIESSLVGFNFPDHDLQDQAYDPKHLSFGKVQELLPAAYILKKYVIDQKIDQIDLYGRSAGGGALINLIAILNTPAYDHELSEIGIGPHEKEQLLKAIQNGIIILDTPLKSVEEIIDLRGSSEELEILAQNYRDSNLRPIDSIKRLKGLCLHIILYFETQDEIIFNRDDSLFIDRLKKANEQGILTILYGNEGGHQALHHAPWEAYQVQLH